MMRVRAAIGFAVLLGGAAPSSLRADASTKYSFDHLGRLASVATELGTTNYKYFESGSIEEMVDPAGWRYSFGEGDAPATLASAGPNFLPSFATTVSSPLDQSANRFLFTGFIYERELGLYLTSSGRLYDPETGRFIQQDSHPGRLSDPPSLHRYLYGHGNPARFIDPTGHSDEDANRLAAAMHGRTGIFASDHRPADQRGWWYNAFSYTYQDLPPRLLPMQQFEGLARQDAKEFAVGTAESVVAALVPPAVKRGAGALVERFPVLGKSLTEAAGEALERLRAPAPAELPSAPVKTVSISEAAKSGDAFVATEDGRLAPTQIAGGSQGADALNVAGTGVAANRAAGNAARDFIAAREAPSLIEQNLRTTGGLRRLDVLKEGDELVGIESKVGRTSLTPRVRQELARDVKLLRSGELDQVRWEFWKSARTGEGGPSSALRQRLDKFGIEIVEHDKAY